MLVSTIKKEKYIFKLVTVASGCGGSWVQVAVLNLLMVTLLGAAVNKSGAVDRIVRRWGARPCRLVEMSQGLKNANTRAARLVGDSEDIRRATMTHAKFKGSTAFELGVCHRCVHPWLPLVHSVLDHYNKVKNYKRKLFAIL